MKYSIAILLVVSVCIGFPDASQGQAPGVVVLDDDALLATITSNGKKLIEAKKLVRLPALVKQLDRTRCKLTLTPVRSTPLTGPEVYQTSRNGTLAVGLLAFDEASGEWYFNAATGFMLTADGAVATSYHVLYDEEFDSLPHKKALDSNPETKSKPETEKKTAEKTVIDDNSYLIAADFDGNVYAVQEVLAADKISDTCILRIDAQGLEPLPLNPNTRPGETVYCFSNPSDMFGHFTQGIITRFFVSRDMPGPQDKNNRAVCFMSVTADFAVGSSGGPILDDRCNVVGQVQSTSSIFADAEEEHPRHPQMVVKAALAVREILELIEQPQPEAQVAVKPSDPAAHETNADSVLPDPLIKPRETGPDLQSTVLSISRVALQARRIRDDFESQSAEIQKQADAAQSTELLQKLKDDAQELFEQTETRCFRLVNAFPEDAAVLPALEFLLLESKQHQGRAFELLCQHHTTSPEIGTTCVFFFSMVRQRQEPLSFPGLSQIETLTRAVVKRNCNRDAVALASLMLARVLILRNGYEAPRNEIETSNSLEAQKLLTSISKHFADVRIPQTPTSWDKAFAGEQARAELQEFFADARKQIGKNLAPKFINRNDLYSPKSRTTLKLR